MMGWVRVAGDVVILRTDPEGELRFPPAVRESTAFMGIELRKVRVDGSKVVVDPGESKLYDQVSRDDDVLRVLDFAFHNGSNGRVLDEELCRSS